MPVQSNGQGHFHFRQSRPLGWTHTDSSALMLMGSSLFHIAGPKAPSHIHAWMLTYTAWKLHALHTELLQASRHCGVTGAHCAVECLQAHSMQFMILQTWGPRSHYALRLNERMRILIDYSADRPQWFRGGQGLSHSPCQTGLQAR